MYLHHHPFCPHSRFIRLVLAEYGIEPELVEERVWERRPDFLSLNPAGETPVMVEQQAPSVPGASIIAEYMDETRGLALGDRRLLPENPADRVEVRRLVAWFNEKMFLEVTEHLVRERIYKRYMKSHQGGGSPDVAALRAARTNIRYHLKYIGWLAKGRNWLAGQRMSHADLAAAAQRDLVAAVDHDLRPGVVVDLGRLGERDRRRLGTAVEGDDAAHRHRRDERGPRAALLGAGPDDGGG